MTLTKDYKYYDAENDWIEIEDADGEDANYGATSFIRTASGGTYVSKASSVPLALNVLGYDCPKDERVSIGKFEINLTMAQIPTTGAEREYLVDRAAVSLMAVVAYDKREARAADHEKRRQQALDSLANSFAKVNKPATEWTGDDVGKLREALGHYDAALAN